MEKIEISTTAEALRLLDRAVSEKGEDYVYTDEPGESCYYFQDDDRNTVGGGADPKSVKPGCIIGHVLSYKGFSPASEPEIARLIENQDVLTLSGHHTYNTNPVRVIIDAPPKVVNVLRAAQQAQDDGLTWGEAIRHARAAASVWYQAEIHLTNKTPSV